MGRRRKGRAVNGIVLLDKPLGGSSNQILQRVRWLYQAAKAGHTGALDPLASGMLPICLGEATKFSQFLLDSDKTYEVTATLGIRTTTSDADGDIVEQKPVDVSEQQVRDVCQAFVGQSKQVPSMFSALKHQGKPLYVYARQGIEVERDARDITIFSLVITRIDLPEVDMVVHCSKGTYIRSLVDDIGQTLGCGAFVSRLHRTRVADYPTDKMVTLEHLASLSPMENESDFAELDALLLPMDTAVNALPMCLITEAQRIRFEHGQSVTYIGDEELAEGTPCRVYAMDGEHRVFLGVGDIHNTPKDQPESLYGKTQFVTPKRRVVYD